MAKVSIIIPSRNCSFVQRTVDDIFNKATGDIEVICLLDGYWPNPPITDHPNLTIVHKGTVGGMRNSLNLGANLAKGKYLLKCDDHCIFGEGFDEILQNDMEDDWLVNPSRYSVDVEKWERKWQAIQYLYVTFPYYHDNMYGNGMHGKKWIGENGVGENMGYKQYYWKERERKDILIDDMMTFQGSFWFMTKNKFFDIGMLDEKHSDLMENEPQELGFKVWLSGGRCVVNKNTWYAHLHKGLTWGRMYHWTKKDIYPSYDYSYNYWIKEQKDFFISVIEKFQPIPNFPQNWKEKLWTA